MVSASVTKELKRLWLLKLILRYKSNKKYTHEKEHFWAKLLKFFHSCTTTNLVKNCFISNSFLVGSFFGDDFRYYTGQKITGQKSFPSRTSLVNVNKSPVFCRFFDTYWKILKWENFIFCAVLIGICWWNLPVPIKIID